jgi:hypothetical protein
MPLIGNFAGGGGGSSTVGGPDPNNKGAYLNIAGLVAAVPAPVLGNYATVAGNRVDWSGTAWINENTNSMTTVVSEAAMLALPNTGVGTFQMAFRTDTETNWINSKSPASSLANWTEIGAVSTTSIPVRIMTGPGAVFPKDGLIVADFSTPGMIALPAISTIPNGETTVLRIKSVGTAKPTIVAVGTDVIEQVNSPNSFAATQSLDYGVCVVYSVNKSSTPMRWILTS